MKIGISSGSMCAMNMARRQTTAIVAAIIAPNSSRVFA